MSLRLLAATLLALVLVTALSVIWARHEARVLFVELQGLQAQRDELNVDWGRLQLEQSAWATKARIERIARDELDMRRPIDVEMVLVEP
ncbi:cell division protein FtsL [Natronospira bacteriovora]|uniref:Cell division protein FtsL n=1 Tax=Natronospira bacteriovora TaxID=3069753 RepID=A0ABU0W660_9GAMM|nr:cell division protein FtsL [Natronospira sp. AB-CW4]MDQ2069513.1 cell division protein FtsL [Natronospira sp. AB-CW4]